jgi:hypothetical protein
VHRNRHIVHDSWGETHTLFIVQLACAFGYIALSYAAHPSLEPIELRWLNYHSLLLNATPP